ncbi:uncharacterized protein HD556DRAFT_1451700 [Suillus plorans]|uniref:Uncharacterized protein n=1 Tax=Suillus plorans TaxID=116603 RepID=A0A9P7DAC9_9AGAM|nr:uncharacterized protein HD556DRAFT_1451700 [Suillus plorans]KAG1784501.1 hypothetical protein HD556DRAFT_1451700 [Suillus plorans]
MSHVCGELRYDQKKLAGSHGRKNVPPAVFQTIPIGPQLQALWLERGSAGTDVLDDVANEMTRHHPVLALCSNGWKVQAIATERYPSWESTHIKKRKKSSYVNSVSSGTKRKITKFSNAPSDSEPPADLRSPTPSKDSDH